MNLVLVADGASSGNGGACGAGVALYDQDSGKLIHSFGKYIGEGTNTYAECMAMVEAITWVIGYVQDMEEALKAAGQQITLTLLSDSILVIKMMTGAAKARDKDVKRYLAEVMSDLDELKAHIAIKTLIIKHIGREYTHEADMLATEAAQEKRRETSEAEFPFLKP